MALRDTAEEVSTGASRLAMVAAKGEARRLVAVPLGAGRGEWRGERMSFGHVGVKVEGDSGGCQAGSYSSRACV